MGSLSYAVGGALAGGGQGAAAVGAEATQAIVREGLVRLQAQYQQQSQERGFGQQKELQARQETFQAGQTEKELKARGGIAQAEMAQKEKLAGQHETEATKRTGMIVQGRRDVASTNAGAKEANANKAKPWQVKNVNVYPTKPDGTPNYGAPPQQKPLLFNPNTNALYAQAGDKLIRWDTDRNAPAVDPKALARTPIDPDEMRRLHADPLGVIPGAYKGGGLTNAENFERLHHYLPVTIGPRLQKGGMVDQSSPAATGDTGGSSELEDQQDQATAEGDSDYANFGDRGPQPDDFQKAQ